MRKMLKMSDDEFAYEEDSQQQSKKAPSWMVVLTGNCQTWLAALPKVGKMLFKFFIYLHRTSTHFAAPKKM